jgi:hypothetical protein
VVLFVLFFLFYAIILPLTITNTVVNDRTSSIIIAVLESSIHRPRSENSIVAHNHPQTHHKFSKPHLPLLLVHPPTQEQEQDEVEDDDAIEIDLRGNPTGQHVHIQDDRASARLPPFSSFENPLRYQFPPVRASPPAQLLGGPSTHQLHHQSRPSTRPPSPPLVTRRIVRPEVYTGSLGNSQSNSTKSGNKSTPVSVTSSPSKNSPKSLFTRTELRIGSSPPTILCNASSSQTLRKRQPVPQVQSQPVVDVQYQPHPYSYRKGPAHPAEGLTRPKLEPESPERHSGSNPLIAPPSTGPSPAFSAATFSSQSVASAFKTSPRARYQQLQPTSQRQPPPSPTLAPPTSQHLPSSFQSTSSTSTRPYPSLTPRSLYYPHAKTSPFVAQRPRLFQRNSVSEIRMTESISPDRQQSSQQQQTQQQQYRRSGSPMSGQREETPTPTSIKREAPQETDGSGESGDGNKTTGSDPQRQAEAEEARDGLGKTPEFDFSARRHSLATSAFISPNAGQPGVPLEPIRVGGPYHGQNAPTHPSPLGLGAGPAGPNSSASSVTRTVSGTGVSQPGGPPGPGSAPFRKRKESHDRAAGYMDPGLEGGVQGGMPSPAMSVGGGPYHHLPPHTSSSVSNNPASSTSHNNTFQIPAPPVFSNPFGNHPSSSSTSLDRLEPPAKRRGSTYDSRMSHLSIAPTGSPPIGTGGEGGPTQPGGMPGSAIPANGWWAQAPDRRDSTASMYSNRSLASSAGGYGSSTTSYSLMSDKGPYATPPYGMSLHSGSS